MTDTPKTLGNEVSAKIIAKSWLDPQFKADLIRDPVQTLRAMGVEIPNGMTFVVQEGVSTNQYPEYTLVLPPRPDSLEAGDQTQVLDKAFRTCSGTWYNLCGCS